MDDINDLKTWGFNFVRLGVMWEAVETAPGVFNQTYLDEVDNLITTLGENGMYTLVDGHQDVISRVSCGEGIPHFYAQEIIDQGTYCIGPEADYFLAPILRLFGVCKPMSDYGFRYDDKNRPLVEDCMKHPFFLYYMSPESQTIFRSLFYNLHGLRDKYVNAWGVISKRLTTNPYVIGFDPLNEPMPAWNSLLMFIEIWLEAGLMDRTQLMPVYEAVYTAFKAVDEDIVLYWEPSQMPDEIGLQVGGV